MDVAALAIFPTSYTSDHLLVIMLDLEPSMTSKLSMTAVRRSCFGEEIGQKKHRSPILKLVGLSWLRTARGKWDTCKYQLRLSLYLMK